MACDSRGERRIDGVELDTRVGPERITLTTRDERPMGSLATAPQQLSPRFGLRIEKSGCASISASRDLTRAVVPGRLPAREPVVDHDASLREDLV